MGRWSRRRFLASGAGLPFLGFALAPDEELVAFSDYGPEFRTDAQAESPRVKSFDLRTLTSLTTPAEDFFAFHQTKTVLADSNDCRLRIGGLVKRPVELSLPDLLKTRSPHRHDNHRVLRKHRRSTNHECVGKYRVMVWCEPRGSTEGMLLEPRGSRSCVPGNGLGRRQEV